jgi:hypothetical protein
MEAVDRESRPVAEVTARCRARQAEIEETYGKPLALMVDQLVQSLIHQVGALNEVRHRVHLLAAHVDNEAKQSEICGQSTTVDDANAAQLSSEAFEYNNICVQLADILQEHGENFLLPAQEIHEALNSTKVAVDKLTEQVYTFSHNDKLNAKIKELFKELEQRKETMIDLANINTGSYATSSENITDLAEAHSQEAEFDEFEDSATKRRRFTRSEGKVSQPLHSSDHANDKDLLKLGILHESPTDDDGNGEWQENTTSSSSGKRYTRSSSDTSFKRFGGKNSIQKKVATAKKSKINSDDESLESAINYNRKSMDYVSNDDSSGDESKKNTKSPHFAKNRKRKRNRILNKKIEASTESSSDDAEIAADDHSGTLEEVTGEIEDEEEQSNTNEIEDEDLYSQKNRAIEEIDTMCPPSPQKQQPDTNHNTCGTYGSILPSHTQDAKAKGEDVQHDALSPINNLQNFDNQNNDTPSFYGRGSQYNRHRNTINSMSHISGTNDNTDSKILKTTVASIPLRHYETSRGMRDSGVDSLQNIPAAISTQVNFLPKYDAAKEREQSGEDDDIDDNTQEQVETKETAAEEAVVDLT